MILNATIASLSSGCIGILSYSCYNSYASVGAKLSVGAVQPGDTLGKIAGRYCTNRQTIYDINGPNSQLENNLWVDLPSNGDYIVTITPVRLPESPQLNFDIFFVIQ